MIVFTYPGQGSQKPAMGKFWTRHPSWALVEQASEASKRDVAALLLDANEDELRMTRNAQLATFAMSMVTFDAVKRLGLAAKAHAGHSLGEYSALTAAGALDFGDAVRLVVERGDAMQAAADESEGTMAALLGLSDEQADETCKQTNREVWIANYNAPGQVVIAGNPQDIDETCRLAKDAGAKRAMRLAVGGAFHTPLMAPAENKLCKTLDEMEFRTPNEPVYANVDAAPHTEPTDWPELLGTQLTAPVRWRQTLETLDSDGFTTFVELGCGAVLSGLAKRTLKGAVRMTVNTPEDLGELAESLISQMEKEQMKKEQMKKEHMEKEQMGKEMQNGVRMQNNPQTNLGNSLSNGLSKESTNFEGEHLFATERLVVSPAAGVFQLAEDCEPGQPITVGDRLGTVGNHEVVSSFAGELVGLLALRGERVTSRQPIAWLRIT